MATPLTSVASAAIIGGDLIFGLSDGSIINCGRVQGPQGLTGDAGPMGATGRDGQDGNTIHTVQGTPDTTLGRDGDYAINVVLWEIYGPRAGGVWGTGTPLRGNVRGNQSPDTTQNLFGSNSPSSGGGGSGINRVNGGAGIQVTPSSSGPNVVVNAVVDTDKGLEIDNDKISIRIGDGLEFDAGTGALKATGGGGGDLSEYAKTTYVDAQDDKLEVRIKDIEDDYVTAEQLQEVADHADSNNDRITDNAAAISNNANAISANETLIDGKASKNALATATAALPYIIETDKALRLADIEIKNRFTGEVAPMYAGGEIYLTDNLQFFSNVRFTGTNNIATSSDAQGIIVDGANLMPKNLLSLPELT